MRLAALSRRVEKLRPSTAVRAALLAGLLATFGATAQAPGDIRVALVIGNAAYLGDAALINPVNDARAMADSLRGLGFTVIEVHDSGKAQMAQAIERVGASLKGKQGVGMLYYAGHGVQLDWRNYMIPVDATLRGARDVPLQTIDVNAVIDAFRSAGNRMNILVLDACRDNPFGRSGAASGKGLAPQDAPAGTFLAYSTAPGNVAEDGDGKGGNGLYTQYLLQELKRPDARIEDVFKRVRLSVRQRSQGRQIPWESTSLEDDFHFHKVAAPSRKVSEEQQRDEDFALQKAQWDKIKDSTDPNDFYTYLKAYPTGLISQLATATLERLAKAQITPQPDRNGIVQSNEPRYRVGDRYEFVIKDGHTGALIEQRRFGVTRIDNGIVYLNDGAGLRTVDGATIKLRGVENFDPPRLDLPGGEFAVGMKWTSRSIQTNPGGEKYSRDDTVRIVAVEDVTVPAGTFKAYKFEMLSSFPGGTTIKLTYWAQPGWGEHIRTIREVRPRRGNPIFEIVEMVSRTRGGG